MGAFFTYTEFISLLREGKFSSYEDGPPDDENFVTRYESALEILENSIRYDKLANFDSESFWEEIQEPEASAIFDNFNDEIEAKAEDLYNKEYIIGFDKENDMEIYSDSYEALRKEAIHRSKSRRNGMTQQYFKKILYENLFVKSSCVKELWPIYKKALIALHELRGRFGGKKFGF